MGWARRKLACTSNRKYRPSDKQKPDATVAKANKRLASRFYQLKMGHCLTGQYLTWTTRHLLVVSVQDSDSGAPLQELPPVEEPAEDSLGDRPRRDPQAPRPPPGPGPHQHRGAAHR